MLNQIVKRMTWGYAILVASWLDMYSDFVGKNRTLGNLGGKDVVYRYGFLGISGVAFSFPPCLDCQVWFIVNRISVPLSLESSK